MTSDEAITSLRKWQRDLENRLGEIDTEPFDMAVKALTEKQDRDEGHWEEKQVYDAAETTITEMQSAKCSVCKRYHTTPYLYSFSHYKFCPSCGSRMGR